LIILALVFAPFYFRTRISTLPEFLEKRYSPVARSLLAFMFIMSALLIHIGISLYAGAAVFQQFFGLGRDGRLHRGRWVEGGGGDRDDSGGDPAGGGRCRHAAGAVQPA
jgi:uncharacterized sodium:solute symporter family permease YidK